MAKLFQFSAFIGKLATLLLVFFIVFSLCLSRSLPACLCVCVCTSIILSSCHDYSFLEFASTLLLRSSRRDSRYRISCVQANIPRMCFFRCDLVNLRFSWTLFFSFTPPPSFFSISFHYFPPKWFLVLDKVNFNAACFSRSKPFIFQNSIF